MMNKHNRRNVIVPAVVCLAAVINLGVLFGSLALPYLLWLYEHTESYSCPFSPPPIGMRLYGDSNPGSPA